MLLALVSSLALSRELVYIELIVAEVNDAELASAVEDVEPALAKLVGTALRQDPRSDVLSRPTFMTRLGHPAEMTVGRDGQALQIEVQADEAEDGTEVVLDIDRTGTNPWALTRSLRVPESGVQVVREGERVIIVMVGRTVPTAPWPGPIMDTPTANALYERLIWHPKPARRARALDLVTER
ncbi:MAG: hypothetical protein AAF211_09025 [Myxococcota bacterium]